ncbi:uncharacterized protein LOC142979495 [Anticarsia gemmatalis]|uniref:uncharacterized protein LOC142979495 n=1 Tax=Anticarsia gemmatalis TaxID=129554 RepID=UPI003F7781E1
MSRVWLLVEWVDAGNDMFSSYGVVNIDTMAYDERELHPGNVIFIGVEQEAPKRAKILRISESKQYVKEHKEILERQNQQVKNMLQMCMRTIQEIKTNNPIHVSRLEAPKYDVQQASNTVAMPHVLMARKADSGSDSDEEERAQTTLPIKPVAERSSSISSFNKSIPSFSRYNRKEVKVHPVRGTLNTTQPKPRPRPPVSSTPLSAAARRNATLCYNQGTQTEQEYLQPRQVPKKKIEEMETVLKNLYTRYLSLVDQVNAMSNGSTGSTSMSESDHNEDVPAIIPNNGESDLDQRDANEPEIVQEVGAEEVLEETLQDEPLNCSNANKNEVLGNPNSLRVRRMSAQTTNNIETPMSNDSDMVPIGNGHAKVPLRLLNDIDWNSHTNATRQLLQAVFPRRVLATHCLTGKQSPAFMNRPPKKILDPKLVEDIVKMVSTRCGVPKNLVRNSITIKCTDEAKLYRKRLQYKLQRKVNENDENRPPSTPSSDDSSNIVIN